MPPSSRSSSTKFTTSTTFTRKSYSSSSIIIADIVPTTVLLISSPTPINYKDLSPKNTSFIILGYEITYSLAAISIKLYIYIYDPFK